MSRLAMLSFAVATLVAFVGCEKKDTNVPGEPTEEADFTPPEEEPEVGRGRRRGRGAEPQQAQPVLGLSAPIVAALGRLSARSRISPTPSGAW